MIRINRTIFKMGTVDAADYSEDCKQGDWETYSIRFPEAFPGDDVRVIVTANDQDVRRGSRNVAVVGIAQDVTRRGFVLASRNSSCGRGSAGFNWMAVLETDRRRSPVVNLRMGVLQPKHFGRDCRSGDWKVWGVTFCNPPFGQESVLLTASDLNVTPWDDGNRLRYHNAAVVGIVRDPTSSGFTLAARNSDCAEGMCAFYYVALSQSGGRSYLWVDTGEVTEQFFGSDCKKDEDWKEWDVEFSEPFLIPPVVLVTANNKDVRGHNAAVVGIASKVTPNGFSIMARNSDCGTGQAGFYWVAIGCQRGCGIR